MAAEEKKIELLEGQVENLALENESLKKENEALKEQIASAPSVKMPASGGFTPIEFKHNGKNYLFQYPVIRVPKFGDVKVAELVADKKLLAEFMENYPHIATEVVKK